MNKFKTWWKEDKRYLLLIKAVLAACLPLLVCMVMCAMQGKTIGEVYLPFCEWNDELFYYKQVEGIINYGFPQGYYGFNESHALKLSFAAWSPVLVWPWILWGLLFGWNLMSPIICNIVLLSLAMFLFVWLTKPTGKQLGVLVFLFCLYTPFARYMLSVMPEIICFSMLIVFYGVAINYLAKEKGYKLAVLFGMAGLLVWMRPYMLLFLFLPAYLWFRRDKWKGVVGSGIVFAVVLGVYALIKHYLGAEYFAPLFFTDWITTFFREGVGAGIRNFFGTLYYMGSDFLRHTVEGFRSGLPSGAFFGGYLVMLGILLWQSISDWRRMRKQKEEKAPALLVIETHLVFCFVGMLFALLLMYKLIEGSKHLLTFMAVGVFVLSLMHTRTYKKVVLMGAVFAFLYGNIFLVAQDYLIPYENEQIQAQIENWETIYDENLVLTGETVPNYENVVIWVLNDIRDGEEVSTEWQLLYPLPEGFGISCCKPDYIKENLETLQSRYLATVAGGEIDVMCRDAAYREIGRDADMVLYERY